MFLCLLELGSKMKLNKIVIIIYLCPDNKVVPKYHNNITVFIETCLALTVMIRTFVESSSNEHNEPIFPRLYIMYLL